MTPNVAQMIEALAQLRNERGYVSDPVRRQKVDEEITRIERELTLAGYDPKQDA